jgi:hypothetical protein
MVEFVPYFISALICIFLIKPNNIHNGLRMLLLFLFRNATVIDHALPFLWQTLEESAIDRPFSLWIDIELTVNCPV